MLPQYMAGPMRLRSKARFRLDIGYKQPLGTYAARGQMIFD